MSTSFKTVILIILLLAVTSNVFADSAFKNALKSAIVPGWGELSFGSKTGYIFLFTEATLWSTRFYFVGESDLKMKQAEQFAYNKANLKSYELNDSIRFLMERYNSSGYGPGGYNESVIVAAIELFPFDPKSQTEYINKNLLDESIYWDWETRENRSQYRIMRKDSAHFDDYAKAVGGTIIVNHIISFLNTLRTANTRQNNSLSLYSGFTKEMTPFLGCVKLF